VIAPTRLPDRAAVDPWSLPVPRLKYFGTFALQLYFMAVGPRTFD